MITDGRHSGLRLIGPIEQIQCTSTGPSRSEDEYQCSFYTHSKPGRRSTRDALIREDISSIHYGDVEIDRLNDNNHSLVTSPEHAMVFGEEGGCIVNKESRALLCHSMAEAQQKFERNEERLGRSERR